MAVGRHRAEHEDNQVAGRQKPAQAAPVLPTVSADNEAGLRPRGASRRAERATHSGPGTKSVVAEPVGAGTEPAGIDVAKPDPILPAAPQKNHDLLFWGIFLAATAAGSLTWARVDWPVTAASSFLLLLAFAAVWKFSSAPSGALPAAATQPAPLQEHRAGDSQEALAEGEAGTSKAEPAAGNSAAEAAMQDLIAAMSADAPSPTAAKEPMTRKEMRAADPTTGVMPVVSVFSRKPTAGSARSNGRTAPPSSAVEPGVPQAPAGRVAKGIDTGQGRPGSRKARRRAEENGLPPAQSTAKPVDAPAVKPAAEPAAAATASSGTADSRWTRTFGPPETGQLPVQQYHAAATAAVPEEDESTERRQRSHSSH